MGLRTAPANLMLQSARSLGNALGAELVVETDDHTINATMEIPDKSKRAWDPDMFVRGQIYRRGYANPIKPVVVHYDDMERMDQVDMEDAEIVDVETDGGEALEKHIELHSSWRYKEYQDQKLVSELVNPREQWALIIYITLAILILLIIVGAVAAYGAFA